eukprot:gnl/TRDRNA2_/TRDRNA2_173103_c1_seq1.p1 gnl/TRDRNA2_/TRDRNA2_173103_c1~~gnl/TRDRNA2_/TRDRNA2_173103_c1_seq1.p1  ORF type:complete len:173 (-),score=26.17 gnl/TRDRNA2_/TRDRNA2_173103_c1_seq1:112-576(-)
MSEIDILPTGPDRSSVHGPGGVAMDMAANLSENELRVQLTTAWTRLAISEREQEDLRRQLKELEESVEHQSSNRSNQVSGIAGSAASPPQSSMVQLEKIVAAAVPSAPRHHADAKCAPSLGSGGSGPADPLPGVLVASNSDDPTQAETPLAQPG